MKLFKKLLLGLLALMAVLLVIARTKVAYLLLWISNLLLLAAIAAFGFITYARPLRLWYERKVARDLRQGRPKIL